MRDLLKKGDSGKWEKSGGVGGRSRSPLRSGYRSRSRSRGERRSGGDGGARKIFDYDTEISGEREAVLYMVALRVVILQYRKCIIDGFFSKLISSVRGFLTFFGADPDPDPTPNWRIQLQIRLLSSVILRVKDDKKI